MLPDDIPLEQLSEEIINSTIVLEVLIETLGAHLKPQIIHLPYRQLHPNLIPHGSDRSDSTG